jgi:hypothetical protein
MEHFSLAEPMTRVPVIALKRSIVDQGGCHTLISRMADRYFKLWRVCIPALLDRAIGKDQSERQGPERRNYILYHLHIHPSWPPHPNHDCIRLLFCLNHVRVWFEAQESLFTSVPRVFSGMPNFRPVSTGATLQSILDRLLRLSRQILHY